MFVCSIDRSVTFWAFLLSNKITSHVLLEMSTHALYRLTIDSQVPLTLSTEVEKSKA